MSTAAATPNSSSNALNQASNSGRQLKMSTAGKGIDAQRKPGSPIDGGQRKPPAKTAWTQGTNPLTQRPTSTATSNGAVNSPKPSQTSPASSGETPTPMRHLSDRMMYLLANLTGLPGIITLKNGEKYSGVLSGTSLDPSELRYVFKMVKKLMPATSAQTNGAAEASEDYVGKGDYHVMSFDMSDVADFNVNNVVLDKSQAKTQNGTSGFRTDTDISGKLAIRERDLQKWEPSEVDPNMSLESSGRTAEWDQFSTNERLFGVKSNYDENLYTTTINKNDPQYAERAARAEKIAREIEGSTATNSHIREERGGYNPADDNGDEEDKYSGPAKVPEAAKEPPKAAPKAVDAHKAITEQLQKPSSAIKSGVAAIPPRKSGRPHDATTNVEHDLLDSFKQFSAAEKLRISDRQRAFARENKAVKLNDLKKFAQNFKLSTPVPSDLVPILAKDETKQQAIVDKANRQAQELKTTPPKASSSAVDPKTVARPAAKPESTQASPSATMDRQQNQRPRPGQPAYASASMRSSHQSMNQLPPRAQGLLSTRLQLNHQQHKQQGAQPYNGVPQPIPAQDMRMPPTGPSQPSSGAQTPSSSVSTRFNVRAHEFKPNPAASTFQPGGNPSASSSPRPNSSRQEVRKPPITSFFGGHRPAVKSLDGPTTFNAIGRLEKEAQASDKPHHSDIAPPFKTPPTWDFPSSNTNKGYEQLFEHAPPPAPLSAPQHVMANGPMSHQHQLPPHLQGAPGMAQGPTPQHTPRGPPVQPHLGQNQHHYEAQHMQYSHSQSSVQPSPRPMAPFMYGAQPQQMPGYPQQVQVPQYGMSPNVQHVTMRNAQGGQFINPQGPAMGGQMMTNQPSNGPFMGMPGNPQMQMYSPAPGPAYPQYGHMPGPGANGFPSPRPGAPMMSHQGSQQGHHQQPPMMYMQPGAPAPQMYQMQPGSMTPMRGPYAQPYQSGHYGSPQQHHQFPQQHRGTPSGSYSQPMMQQHSTGPQVPPTGPANVGPDGSNEPK
ncbi:PBP1 Protein interacting with poly(A)-binding protein [Pyrenophora tritici-repentis]|nr:PBP1 Protein interacting with poly(A)-binding protein [Pyrenophora tritici-repentis]KAI0585338.1 PBP1 Protein interacting with poly(A)-binding protein [Pyrenophora tritici-repentis]KAI0625038.1 PBP1 Protein interacting with poly(A)-binding protein [Pyrenophora tritici-repentis]